MMFATVEIALSPFLRVRAVDLWSGVHLQERDFFSCRCSWGQGPVSVSSVVTGMGTLCFVVCHG